MGAGSDVKPAAANPYVGPRPFTRDEARLFFGRENEARDLLSLVVSEQLVLFYAQSGAGKSSLINTRLVPGLEDRKFEVLPLGRVSGDILKHDQCDNIFAFNLFTNLDQSKIAPERFIKMRLKDFLANLAFDGHQFVYTEPSGSASSPESQAELDISGIQPRVLIIDQFEEIVTAHPEAWNERAPFFDQVAEAMQEDPYLWVVFVMREDYVASLDPFSHLLPNQLRARFYMRRMEYGAALEAVRRPVEKLRPFDPGIAETLVNNLRIVTGTQIQDGSAEQAYGEFIEPVQLQVVCFQLWSSLMKEPDATAPGKHITQADINNLAKGENLSQFVNKALGDFYEQALASVLGKLPGRVSELELRDWFSKQLITEAETRGLVYQGKTHTNGLPNDVVNLLASNYIIRPDNRPGGTWFELIHDRFIGPILQSNRRWMAANQSRLSTDAKKWEETGQPASMLYEGKQLETAEAEILQKGEAITEVEKKFVSAAAQVARDRRKFRNGMISAALLMLFLVLSGLTWWALSSRSIALTYQSDAVQARDKAETESAFAIQARDEALAAQTVIFSQKATAEFQTTALVQQALNQRNSISRLQTQVSPLLAAPVLTSPPLIPVTGSEPSPTLINITPATTPTAVYLLTAQPTPTAQVAERRVLIGKSAGGKNILAYQFGTGPRHIIFVGGLHAGYAPSTVALAQKLINYLHSNIKKISPAFTVDVILNANPDSMTNQDLSAMVIGRFNGNGVELNANWDCNWRTDATWSSTVPVNGGKSAFSEPESRALRDFILNNLSIAVIVLEAHQKRGYTVTPGGCGEVSVFSQPLADEFANAANFTSSQYIAYDQTGAMIDWLDSQSIPSISVFLVELKDVKQSDLDSMILGLNEIIRNYSKSSK